MKTVYYLPILWSISSCIYTLHFVRNRSFVQLSFYQIKNVITSKCYKHSRTVHANSAQNVFQPPPQSNLHIHDAPKIVDDGKIKSQNHLTVPIEIGETQKTTQQHNQHSLSIDIDAPHLAITDNTSYTTKCFFDHIYYDV